jgi:hypothetical protein
MISSIIVIAGSGAVLLAALVLVAVVKADKIDVDENGIKYRNWLRGRDDYIPWDNVQRAVERLTSEGDLTMAIYWGSSGKRISLSSRLTPDYYKLFEQIGRHVAVDTSQSRPVVLDQPAAGKDSPAPERPAGTPRRRTGLTLAKTEKLVRIIAVLGFGAIVLWRAC